MLQFILIWTFALLSPFVMSTDDIVSMANQHARELDEKLILVDPTAALSDEQRHLVVELFIDKITKTREIKALNTINKASQIKLLMKDIMKKLHYSILTKKQRDAKFEYQQLYQKK